MSASKWAYMPAKCDGHACPGDCDLCSRWEENDFIAAKMLEQINRAMKIVEENGAREDSICMNRHMIDALQSQEVFSIGESIPRPAYATVCGLDVYENNGCEDFEFCIYSQGKVHPKALWNGAGRVELDGL